MQELLPGFRLLLWSVWTSIIWWWDQQVTWIHCSDGMKLYGVSTSVCEAGESTANFREFREIRVSSGPWGGGGILFFFKLIKNPCGQHDRD